MDIEKVWNVAVWSLIAVAVIYFGSHLIIYLFG